MTQRKRSYSDDAFATNQTLMFTSGGALNGTATAAATILSHTCLYNCKVSDWNGRVKAGGTDAGVISLIIGKSAAGTGAFSAIGTMALGTHAINTVIDATMTETDFDAGDDIVIQRSAGTSTSVLAIAPTVAIIEKFIATE